MLRALFGGLFLALRRLPVSFVLYFTNLLLAVVIVAPLVPALIEDAGPTPRALAERLDLEFLVDFLFHRRGVIESVGTAAGVGALAMVVVQCFLAGGVLTLARDPRERFSLGMFMLGAGRWFLPFLRLLPFLALWLFALYWVNRALNLGFERLFEEEHREKWALGMAGVKQALVLLFWFFGSVVLDFARVRAVALGDRRMLLGFLAGLNFVLRHFFSTLCLSGFLALLGVAFFAGYLWLVHVGLGASRWLALTTVALQQALVLVQHFLRVWRASSQMILFQLSRRDEESAPATVLDPTGAPIA
jgi:hypothetical protein